MEEIIFPKYKTIFFDLGGVLFTSGTKKFIGNLSKRYNKSFEEVERVVDGQLARLYKEAKITRDDYWGQIVEVLGLKESVDELVQEWLNGYELILATKKIIFQVKKRLRSFYLSDNIEEKVESLNQRFGFLSWFHGGVFSYEAGISKPSPLIFQAALKRAMSEPREAVFIDDKQVNVAVARKMGMAGFLFETPKKLEEELASRGFLEK